MRHVIALLPCAACPCTLGNAVSRRNAATKTPTARRAERYETSVEVLVWLPAYSPAQRAAQAAEAAALSTAAALLTGCCEVVSCPVAAAAAPVDEHHQQQQPGVDCGNTPCRASVSGSEPGATAAARDEEEPEALLLLSGGGDGHVRVWDIDPVGQGTLLCVLPGVCCGVFCCTLPGVICHAMPRHTPLGGTATPPPS
jgi:hypothetical protein